MKSISLATLKGPGRGRKSECKTKHIYFCFPNHWHGAWNIASITFLFLPKGSGFRRLRRFLGIKQIPFALQKLSNPRNLFNKD